MYSYITFNPMLEIIKIFKYVENGNDDRPGVTDCDMRNSTT